MARKLKTYQTSLGFFDLAIAAPSMKAALQAWGSDTNLFHQGFAKETDDPAIVAATLAKPGVVLRRPVGSEGAFSEHAELPKELPIDNVKERSAKPRATTSEPPAQKVDDEAAREAALAFERERKRRDCERRKEEIAREKERKRREQAIAKAEQRLKKRSVTMKPGSKKSKETAPHSTDSRKRRTRAGKSRRRNWKPLCAGRATSHVAMSGLREDLEAPPAAARRRSVPGRRGRRPDFRLRPR
jgi:colicin import membrane protein